MFNWFKKDVTTRDANVSNEEAWIKLRNSARSKKAITQAVAGMSRDDARSFLRNILKTL